MDIENLTFLGGLLLGLASSLHCAGMCGAIASSIMFSLSGGDTIGDRLAVLLPAQAGKIVAYTLAGGLVGLAGSSVYGVFDQSAGYRILQWASAVTLGWIGLTLTGLAPSLALLDRVTRPVIGLIAAGAPGVGSPGTLGLRMPTAFLSGLAWGFLPCGMVFGALFYAMLSGSAGGGASVMLGFGVGTLPSVTAPRSAWPACAGWPAASICGRRSA
ncbi:sulfite exporter TauE/SafE family protein [Methylobrevis pamukkalensis]|uniref:Urease accessory protein UreH-like transmembrane domain-containing protein n=1 Tax=Methylobrevis pamukkalensis TaxID=1439726 RepID=A0A1E3GZ65_9HYPH|nr:sulfite exporter TauE/SafE family protein [Methylobrevis pamukkalensis]ODN69324.1 hypothetical protein A6302_03379 [Methylobrevis pamukkalensis]